MYLNQRRALLWALLLALVTVGATFGGTFASIVQKWYDDTTFSHGFLIVPIAIWLAWRQRHALASVQFKPSWFGVAAVVFSAAAWVVARGSGVLVIEQFAAVAFAPALVLAILGLPAARVLAFPLAFLFFAVPFGRGIVPWLMQATADISVLALQWSGVPVLRSHMYISIPAGSFEVARACSGLSYSITGLVLGILYAHLSYRGWVKRILCVAAFVVVPIVANGLRVYITILVSHLTDMRFGPGTEHIAFGRVFFLVVMLAMFWVGRRWHDEAPTASTGSASLAFVRVPLISWAAVAAALMAVLAAPVYLNATITKVAAQSRDGGANLALPAGSLAWQGPVEGAVGWRPLYRGGMAEQQAVYVAPDGLPVEVFVSVYGLGMTMGAEMIASGNVLFAEEQGSLAAANHRRLSLPDGGHLEVREVLVPFDSGERLVWHWYMVGQRPITNEFEVKAYEAIAFLTRRADLERIVTLATPADEAASERLETFLMAHATCVASGFAAEACGR